MNTKQYVKQFYSNKEGTPFFDTEGFLIEFNKEFTQRLKTEEALAESLGVVFSYNKFQYLVKEMDNKFKSINNKLPKMDLSVDIFSTFFARHVIPVRKEKFPEIHEAISAKRAEYIKAEQEAKKKSGEFIAGAYHDKQV